MKQKHTRTAAGPAALAAVSLLLFLPACTVGDGQAEDVGRAAAHVPVHVDSVFPIEEEIRRFQAALPDAPRALEGGAGSRAALVDSFLEALQREDVEALRGLLVTRAEFGYLYYPTSRHTRAPYELSPALVWFQMETRGGRGLARALRRYGGVGPVLAGYRCDPDPVVEGENRLWTGCALSFVADGHDGDLVLFGPILERDGRFKFLTYANAL